MVCVETLLRYPYLAIYPRIGFFNHLVYSNRVSHVSLLLHVI